MQPERIGDYIVDREIGRGGMGIVYLGYHESSREAVAIKIMPTNMAQTESFASRFQREIDVMKKLDHPNIVRMIESGTFEEQPFYVMEYIAGESIETTLNRRNKLPWAEVIDLGIQICKGLKHAHDSGVIHRDLKPANLLVDESGNVHLTDFGIARVFAGTQLTATGKVIGTAEYMSPEQAEGKRVTPRSDIYSLGVVLYAMLIGRPPFSGRSTPELLHMHRYAQFDSPATINPSIPSWLDELVCSLLAKKPEDRPHDAHAVRRKLEIIQKRIELRNAPTVETDFATVVVDPKADQVIPETKVAESPRTIAGPTRRTFGHRVTGLFGEPGSAGPIAKFFDSVWVLVPLLLICALVAWYFVGSAEERRWERIQQEESSASSDSDYAQLVISCQSYLDRWPEGQHVTEASQMLEEAKRSQLRNRFRRLKRTRSTELQRLAADYLEHLDEENPQSALPIMKKIIQGDWPNEELFLVEMAVEDFYRIQIQKAEAMVADGQADEARRLIREVLEVEEPLSVAVRRFLRTRANEMESGLAE